MTKETEKKGYSTSLVATQTQEVIIDPETEEQVSSVDLLVKIANDIAEIKKHIVG